MVNSDLFKNTLWIGSEFLKIFYSPVGVAGGFIDAFRGWKFSRSWVRFWFHLPSLVLLVAVYLIFGFSVFSRVDSRVQLFTVESEKRCSTKTLEAISDEMRENDFCKAIDWVCVEKDDTKTNSVTDRKNRYVELLSKRILSIQPANQSAHYRLGMIYSLTGQMEAAVSEMTGLANGNFGECPQANAWMAKELLKQTVAGVRVSSQELLGYLEKASKWKDVDFRLISFYARMLEKKGETNKAISIAKQAAIGRPELTLELARLYSRIGSKAELQSAATSAEEVFIKKLNSPVEKESDRLAVAEARKLTDRLEQAAEILTEGLLKKSSGPITKRELSEIQRMIFLKTVFKTEAGVFQAELAMLEKAAETDPTNPNISSEISKLRQLEIKPTKKLLDVLRKQIDLGFSSVTTHISLAEGLFQSGNIQGAIKNWETALAKDPNNLGVLNNLSLCLARESEMNVPRSLELLTKALALAPGNAEILDTLGDVLLIAKRPQEAIAKFELAIRFDKSRNGTRKKLVTAYRLTGMDGMAEATSKVIEKIEQAKSEEEAKAQEKSVEK